MCRAAFLRCRWWSARAPRPAPGISSRCSRVIRSARGDKAAIFVGERRWNLRLKDGLDIRLPENDVGNALAALSRLDKEDRLFSRDIVAVDMRLPDRLTVQLSEDAAKAAKTCSRTRRPEEGR